MKSATIAYATLFTMMVWTRFSARLRRAVASSAEISAGYGCEEIAVEHLLIAILLDAESAATLILNQGQPGTPAILENLRSTAPTGNLQRQRAARLSSSSLHLFDLAAGEADRLGHPHIGTEHIALAMILGNYETGLTREQAEIVLENLPPRSPRKSLLDKMPAAVRKAVKFPSLVWKVYVGKSLAHPRFSSDPYPLYRWLRENAPIRRDPIVPVWVATRYADVVTMLKDPRFNKDPFASGRLPAIVREQLGITDDQVRTGDVETLSMLFLDPPQHTRVRAVFSKAFTPKMISGLRPRIQQITNKRLEKVLAAGQMDVIETIAYPLPVVVIAELLGFPAEDYPQYKKWSDDFAAALGLNPSMEQQFAAAQSRQELQAYFDRLVPQLEKQPGDNLLSALFELKNQSGGITREEIFINSALLLAAGHETTTNLIGNGIWHLLQNPTHLEELRREPELIESAVEELMRFDSPVQWVSRVVREPIEIGGVQLKPGTVLLGSLGAANRDKNQFPDPDRLDLRRADNKHLAFGSGIHFCLGAALARMEAQIAIGTMIQTLPNLRLVRQKIRWKKGLIFRAIERLEVEFDAVGE